MFLTRTQAGVFCFLHHTVEINTRVLTRDQALNPVTGREYIDQEALKFKGADFQGGTAD